MSSGDPSRPANPPRGKGPPPLPPRLPSQSPPLPVPSRSLPPLPRLAQPLLRQGELDGYANLLLFAEAVVQGFFSGRHRSLDFGSSAEFAEFKPYQAGDPVSQVDWKVFARSRRLMIRRNREEKEMTAWLVVDVSGSMAYQAQGREAKSLRAARIAAALATLMQRQGDRFSLTLFNQSPCAHLPAGSTRRHLMDCLTTLEHRMAKPSGLTSAGAALDLCSPMFRRRGSLIVISDFFTDLDIFFRSLAQFQHRGFDILLLHVTDPDERLLPGVPMAHFVDMETGTSVEAVPDEIRAAYRREMEVLMARMEDESMRRGIAWHLLRTEDPWREALEAWLGLRGKTRIRSAR